MESLCLTCVRRKPSPINCAIPLGQIRAAQQPVSSCPFFEDASGRVSTHDLTGLLNPARRPLG